MKVDRVDTSLNTADLRTKFCDAARQKQLLGCCTCANTKGGLSERWTGVERMSHAASGMRCQYGGESAASVVAGCFEAREARSFSQEGC